MKKQEIIEAIEETIRETERNRYEGNSGNTYKACIDLRTGECWILEAPDVYTAPIGCIEGTAAVLYDVYCEGQRLPYDTDEAVNAILENLTEDQKESFLAAEPEDRIRWLKEEYPEAVETAEEDYEEWEMSEFLPDDAFGWKNDGESIESYVERMFED